MVVSKDGSQAQRFLAVDVYQMSLVEPETKRLGWGVVKFAGLLQVRRKKNETFFSMTATVPGCTRNQKPSWSGGGRKFN